MLQQVISQSIIPILIGVVFLFFAIRVLVFKDTWMMRGRNKPEPKDKEGFCKEAGMILLFSSVAAFAVAVLEVIDPLYRRFGSRCLPAAHYSFVKPCKAPSYQHGAVIAVQAELQYPRKQDGTYLYLRLPGSGSCSLPGLLDSGNECFRCHQSRFQRMCDGRFQYQEPVNCCLWLAGYQYHYHHFHDIGLHALRPHIYGICDKEYQTA